MNPDGPLAVGTVAETQALQTDVTLQPSKCYVVVGRSTRVRELDLYLLLQPGIVSAHDTTDGNTPVLGGDGHPICPSGVVPVTYKLAIVATEGAGDVAVQLYSKAR